MTSLLLAHDNDRQIFDLARASDRGWLATDEGLATAVECSLFTDARIDEAEAKARDFASRRGYWADVYLERVSWGSTLWALVRDGATPETARRVEGRARAALAWLVRDGAAESVETSAIAVERGAAAPTRIELTVRIKRPVELASRYQPLWEATYAL